MKQRLDNYRKSIVLYAQFDWLFDSQLVCRICSPPTYFTRYNSLRAHLRATHRVKDVSDSQIGLYENYTGARNHMIRDEPRQSSSNQMAQASIITAAVAEGRIFVTENPVYISKTQSKDWNMLIITEIYSPKV